jgi:hypothetical protein
VSEVKPQNALFSNYNTHPGLERWEYSRGDPLHWPRDTLNPQKLALTSPTSSGRSVDIVHSRTEVTEFLQHPSLLCVPNVPTPNSIRALRRNAYGDGNFTFVIIYLSHQLIRSGQWWAHLCTRHSRQHIIPMPFWLYLTRNIFSQYSEFCLKCGEIGEMKYLLHRALTYQIPLPCHVGRAWVTRDRSKTQTDVLCDVTALQLSACFMARWFLEQPFWTL